VSLLLCVLSAGLLGLYITSLLMTLGIIFYSYKLHAGYSFILMIISGEHTQAQHSSVTTPLDRSLTRRVSFVCALPSLVQVSSTSPASC